MGCHVERERAPRIAIVAAAVTLAACLLMPAVAWAQGTATFSAHGSAEQVYVTGLAPYARISLLTRGGRTLSRRRADSLGGLLFRNVPPGHGYRVRLLSGGEESGPIAVHSDAAAPWDPSVYKQAITDNG